MEATAQSTRLKEVLRIATERRNCSARLKEIALSDGHVPADNPFVQFPWRFLKPAAQCELKLLDAVGLRDVVVLRKQLLAF